jgi:hypothetical protein
VVINFIVNPTSGRGRGKKAIRVIKEELTGKKIDFNIQTTTPSRSAITLAKQAVEDGYSKASLTVDPDNDPAIHVYKDKLGFEKKKQENDVYGEGIDRYYMELDLAEYDKNDD